MTSDFDQLRPPAVSADSVKRQIRMTLLSARTSSRIGYAIVAIPALIIGVIVLHYGFGAAIPGFATLENAMSYADKRPSLHWLSPALFVLAPLAACAISFMGIAHFSVDRVTGEANLTVKLRWANIVVILLSTFVVATVFAHAVAESGHRGG